MSAHDDLPPDPDLDDLPPEIAEHPGPFFIEATDPETGETHRAQVTRDALAATFAQARRAREDA